MRLKLLNLPTDAAVKRLADGVIDFAFVRKDAVARPLQARALGVMSYSLFVPNALKPVNCLKDCRKFIDQLPLATLDGDGAFRSALAQAVRKAGIKMNVQIECSSFPLAARAVAKAKMAAILPTIAATDLQDVAVAQVAVPFLKSFDREMCLASNPRLIRIRPILQNVAEALAQVCSF